jgi:hypothetical protein
MDGNPVIRGPFPRQAVAHSWQHANLPLAAKCRKAHTLHWRIGHRSLTPTYPNQCVPDYFKRSPNKWGR